MPIGTLVSYFPFDRPILIMVEYDYGGVFSYQIGKETTVSTLKNIKKKENAAYAHFSAHFTAGFSAIKGHFKRIGVAGRQKLTIMFIPHTEKKILNVQLSFFALTGLFCAAALLLDRKSVV